MSETMMNKSAREGNLLSEKRIRTIALCLFRRGDSLLVAESYNPNKGQTFYRSLGGGIEFGERAADTVVREIREELGVEIEAGSLRYLFTMENIFTYLGQPGHEIVLIFDGAFADAALYQREELVAHEDDNAPFKAIWKRLDEFGPGAPLYPDGLVEMLKYDTIEPNEQTIS